jgi:type IV pilus assembly protein PilV
MQLNSAACRARHATWIAGARGFSLVEVLVALIVISVGLLGIAKMQALALSNMTTSRLRALAAFEAAGLVGAMHSNRDFWASTPANFTVTVNPAAASPIVSNDPGGALGIQASADYLAGDPGPGVTPGQSACVGAAAGLAQCANSTNLAAYDLARWTASLHGLLPNPTATIGCPNVAGSNLPTSCTIQISWVEKAVSITQQGAAQQEAGNVGQFETPTYLVYVEP